MKKRFAALTILQLIIILMLGMTPARSLNAEPELYHSMDNALLLMISSQMRVSGEVTSAHLPGGGHLLLPSPQEGGPTEVDVLIDLYEAQVNKLRESDDFNPDLEDQLITDLEDKLVTLNAKAQAVNAQRSQSRRRGGVLGILNRAVKGLGRGAGWLMGQAMDGAGKIAEFAIEDVAPQVLKEAIQGGTPLTAALVRQVARRLLIDRIGDAIYLQQYRRANRLANNAGDLDPVAQASQDAWDDEFMEAFNETDDDLGIAEGPSLGAGIDDPVPTPGGIGEGSSGGSGITEKRPVRFTNNGFETVTIRPSSYTPVGGGTADLPVGSTVVSPTGGSSALLELPLGEYIFCFDWDRGIDYDEDGYTDYEHGYTGSFSLSESASTDPNRAVVVTFEPPGNKTGRGKCSEQVEVYTNLTSQEAAAVEYHTYANTETENSGEVHTWTDTRRYEFTETGVFIIFPDMGVVGFYQRIGPNEYLSQDSLTTTTLTFNNEGMVYVGTYNGGYTSVSIRID